jgi:hypothetical protein
MMKKCTQPKIFYILSFLVLFISTNVFAQPANDDCSGALELTIGADEASCTPVAGNTVGATGSTTPASVCSGSWFGDDIWYSFTTPNELAEGGYIVKALFGGSTDDVLSVGLAVYSDCGNDSTPLYCFSDDDPERNSILIYPCNVSPNTTYYVRVWSTPTPTDNSGALEMCVFENQAEPETVLWGDQPGQGDFDGGLNGWTITNDAPLCSDTFQLWQWQANPIADGGAFSGGVSILESPTACNGAMVFDSDFYDNGGDSNTQGQGPCPAIHTGEIISPAIDISGFNVPGISVKFFQGTRQFTSNYTISYSNDNGDTWIDVTVNEEIEVNSPHIQEFKRVFLPQADFTATEFRIKFRYEGNYYYWMLDDIQLVETEANNLVVMDNFYAIAPNAMWPASQLEPFSFLADINNVGAAQQPNTTLNMTITDADGNEVYSEDLSYGTTEADSLYENVPFNGAYDPTGSAPGTVYTGTYTIFSDSVDFDPSDNTQSFSFMVTDTVFAKETGATRTIVPADGNWADGESHSWAYGNFFHIVNGVDFDIPSNGWEASAASFGIGNADAEGIAGRLVTINLYQWNEDSNEDGNMDPDERSVVGFNIYEITGTEPSDSLITIPLMPFPSGEGNVPILSGENYVLMVEYNTQDEVNLALVGAEPWDYAGQNFRSGLDDIPYRPGEMLGISGDLATESYSAAGFTGLVVPSVRLHISQPPMVLDVNQLDEANLVQLTPNPATNYINLQVDLVNQQEEVQVQVLDITGKIMINQYYDGVSAQTFSYDISRFSAGTYILNFITKEGMRTERFVIQR